jgi:STE24 endopeptidase
MKDARKYENAKYAISAAGFLVNTTFLILLLVFRWTSAIRDFAGRVLVSPSPSAVVLVYAILVGGIFTLLQLPLDFVSGFVLEHRFGLSRQSLDSWVKDQLKSLAVGAPLTLAGMEIIYYFLRQDPQRWWIYSSLLFIAFFVLLTNLAPVLLLPIFFKFTPVEDEELRRRLDRLARYAGTQVRGLFEWSLGEKTRKANAAVVGWGNTRRIIVSDTLLKNFSAEEIEAIMAHELCHHVKAHIWWGILVQSVLTLVSFRAIDYVLRTYGSGFQGLGDIANFPLLGLTGLALSLLVLPGVNYFSRRLETAADLYALDATGDALAFVSSMEKLAELNLANKSPNKIIEFIFYSHPSVEQRIRLAADRVGQNV